MSKMVVFCADGTWKGATAGHDTDPNATPTNVYKLFGNLAGATNRDIWNLKNEIELTAKNATGQLVQVAKYIHGIGDSDNMLNKLLGGGTGAGFVSRIVRGYTFLSRHYRPGDRIALVGFSRGAYTVRALSGLINARGLLDANRYDLESDRDEAYKLGAAMWYDWRREKLMRRRKPLQQLAEVTALLPGFLTRSKPKYVIPNVRISAVGVWDTVGSLGVPVLNDNGFPIDAFRFADTALSGNVDRGFHAIAVDEERMMFPPTMWDADPRVMQSLFPGSHSDVGGGYRVSNGESCLSDSALVWMQNHLAQMGVIFSGTPWFPLDPNPAGVAHQEWRSSVVSNVTRQKRYFLARFVLERSASLNARIGAGQVIPHPGQPAEQYLPQNI